MKAALLLLLPATLSAQTPRLRVEAGGRTAQIEGVRSAGSVAWPVHALAAMGARLDSTTQGVRARLFNDTLTFITGSPFFTARGAVHPLASPVRRGAGGILIPQQFFAEWLPAAYPSRVTWTPGVLRVSGPVVFPEPAKPAEKPPRIVVIDPGHGGEDTGKIGPNGVREKDAALQYARRLADSLTRRGYEVHLTRTRDTLIALADRARLANRWKGNRPAAIFVSLHMNSTDNGARAARGFETFFLAAAQTEDERRVAEMENAAVQFEDGEAHAASEADLILNGLKNDFWLRASSDLADVIQENVSTVHSGPNRGVKRAGFTVLVGALMPAVLVEVGFISHASEARLLAQDKFQQQVAGALAAAIARFFDGHEPLWTGG